MRHYLAKSEPETRLEKGVDVSFPLSRLASSESQRTTWEGVRNAVAGKTLRGMAVGDQVLFYHSNCKLPGIAGLTEVSAEPMPDESAWDSSHPYYDAKTDKANPKWFMPEVKYVTTFDHFVPLALLQHISGGSFKQSSERAELTYLSDDQLDAISEMDLLKRGRLSVQNVTEDAFAAICAMGAQGGWESWPGKWNAGKARPSGKGETAPAAGTNTVTPKVAPRPVGDKKRAREEPEDAKQTPDGRLRRSARNR
ncbi:unnamed protein product [Parajaminaea phylloscopi]